MALIDISGSVTGLSSAIAIKLHTMSDGETPYSTTTAIDGTFLFEDVDVTQDLFFVIYLDDGVTFSNIVGYIPSTPANITDIVMELDAVIIGLSSGSIGTNNFNNNNCRLLSTANENILIVGNGETGCSFYRTHRPVKVVISANCTYTGVSGITKTESDLYNNGAYIKPS